jgi:hypothetical protein
VAFSVQDFHDFVRLLEERPEWRVELRRLVLTEELLGLPAIVRQLAEAQERTGEQMRALAEAQQRTEQEVRALAEAQSRTEARLNRLEPKFDHLERRFDGMEQRFDGLEQHLTAFEGRTEERFDRLEGRFDRLTEHVADLRGRDRERFYRDRASAYFGRLLRRVRVVPPTELDELLAEGMASGALAEGMASGALDEDTAQDVRWADLIVGGRRPGEDRDTYLVIEVSAAVDEDDVERAARRAAALGRLRPTLAVVAGDRLTPEAAALAEARGVWQMLDGRMVQPGSAA